MKLKIIVKLYRDGRVTIETGNRDRNQNEQGKRAEIKRDKIKVVELNSLSSQWKINYII